MRLTKKLTITGKDHTVEINIKQTGNAKYDSEEFRRRFNNMVDSIAIALIKGPFHFSEIK